MSMYCCRLSSADLSTRSGDSDGGRSGLPIGGPRPGARKAAASVMRWRRGGLARRRARGAAPRRAWRARRASGARRQQPGRSGRSEAGEDALGHCPSRRGGAQGTPRLRGERRREEAMTVGRAPGGRSSCPRSIIDPRNATHVASASHATDPGPSPDRAAAVFSTARSQATVAARCPRATRRRPPLSASGRRIDA